jgi:anti-sigma factor RsiW
MSCEFSQEVHAWHDGELSEARRQGMGEHLAVCSVCQRELRELEALSRMLGSFQRRSAPADVTVRLHQSVERMGERSVLRIAEALTAAAAIVLAIGLAALMSGRATIGAPANVAMEVVLPEEFVAAQVEPATDTNDPLGWMDNLTGQGM